MALNTPLESPLWWTLSDEISPAELRRTYRDPGDNRKRFEAAAAAGLVPQVPAEQLNRLRFAASGRLYPELTPMWLAFWFAGNRYFRLLPDDEQDAARAAALRKEGSDAMQRELAGFGVSAAGAIRISQEAERCVVEIETRRGEVRELQMEFAQMLFDAVNRDPGLDAERSVSAAERSRDLEFFVRATDRTPAEVSKLFDAARRNPPAEVSGECVVVLHGVLEARDWAGLRRYLLERVAVDDLLQVPEFESDSLAGVKLH